MSNEHIKALFEGQELSDEFKARATAIIESMVTEETDAIKLTLDEEFDTRVDAKVQELEALTESYIQDELLPNVDKYLTAATNEWITENRSNIVEASKVTLAENFLSGLVGLVESNNLKVPESKVDVVAKLEESVLATTVKLNTLVEKNIDLETELVTFKRAKIVESVSQKSKLSEVQLDKLTPVISKLEFKSEQQFSEALQELVTSYHPTSNLNESQKPEVIVETKGEDSYVSDLFGRLRATK